jgi:hypothetical protein
MPNDPQNPTAWRFRDMGRATPPRTERKLDAGRPFTAERLSASSSIHIYGADAYSIVATVHVRPGYEPVAARMAAAEELFDAAEKAMRAHRSNDPVGLLTALVELGRAIEKAKTPPKTS